MGVSVTLMTDLVTVVNVYYQENRKKLFMKALGEGNLIFCCTDSRENYFGSVGRQNNNNDPKF